MKIHFQVKRIIKQLLISDRMEPLQIQMKMDRLIHKRIMNLITQILIPIIQHLNNHILMVISMVIIRHNNIIMYQIQLAIIISMLINKISQTKIPPLAMNLMVILTIVMLIFQMTLIKSLFKFIINRFPL